MSNFNLRSVTLNTLFLANANNGSGSLWTIIIFVVLIALMYFTMIKPQKKQQQKKMEMMNQLKKGDSVIMIDGLHGKIDSVNTKDKTVVLDADGIYLTFSRMAVQQILPGNATNAEPASASADTDKTEEAKQSEPTTDQKPDQPAEKPAEEKPANSAAETPDKSK